MGLGRHGTVALGSYGVSANESVPRVCGLGWKGREGLMSTVKLGVVGLGNMGTTHIGNLLAGKCPELELTAVADCDPARVTALDGTVPADVRRFDSAGALIGSGVADAVLIAVPHYDHPRYAIEALRAGLHVMIEKPAGVYTKQVREMNAVAAASDRTFALMFNQRTNPVYIAMHELVQGGTLGRVRRTNWVITNWYRPQAYYDSGGWRATWAGEGGGVLLNQSPHNLDLWQWIGGMPVRVWAHCRFGAWHDIEVEDDVTAVVEYADGATGVFVTSTSDVPGTNRFEVTLDKGKLVAEGGKLTLWETPVTEPEFSRTNTVPFGTMETTPRVVAEEGQSSQHVGVLNAFAGHILRGEPLIAGAEEGIKSLELANAMLASTWLGGWVDLPIDEDRYYAELAKRVATSRRKPDTPAVVAGLGGTWA